MNPFYNHDRFNSPKERADIADKESIDNESSEVKYNSFFFASFGASSFFPPFNDFIIF